MNHTTLLFEFTTINPPESLAHQIYQPIRYHNLSPVMESDQSDCMRLSSNRDKTEEFSVAMKTKA
jgi:hypothetical protein